MVEILKGDGAAILGVFIGSMIAIVILSSVSHSIVLQTTTQSIVNQTITLPATTNATIDLIGRELVSGIITNATGSTGAALTNYTLQTGMGSGGLLTVQLASNSSTDINFGLPANVSYIYRPDGYLNLGGARSVNRLVLIIGALAILVFVIVIFYKKGSFGELMRRT